MSEAKREKPALIGLDLVLQQALYGLIRYPQADLMSDALTLNAIFSDPNPRVLIERYLNTPLPKEAAEHMLERARRAHSAYLSEEKIPEIDSSDIERTWELGKDKVQEALLFLLAESREAETNEEARTRLLHALSEGNLPFAELKAVAAAVAKAFADSRITTLLEAYREQFRGEHFVEVTEVQKEIQKEVFILMRQDTREDGLDKEKLERVFKMFEGLERV